MSEVRAILVSREQRNELAWDYTENVWPHVSVETRRGIASAFDAAGGQPTRRVCMTHLADGRGFPAPCRGMYSDCRVVDAIVVPIEGGDG